MSYDHWKCTDPADMELGAEQEPELEPELDRDYPPDDLDPQSMQGYEGEPDEDDELPF